MTARKTSCSSGFTLVEMMIALVLMIITASAIGAVIVDSQNSWGHLYNRVNGNVVTDGYVAKKKFDAIIRKAGSEQIVLNGNRNWVEVYYYSSDSATVVDRYARFFTSGKDLMIEYGQLNPKVTLNMETVCANVSSCKFDQKGCSVQMFLKLDNGTQANTVITSAVANN